MTKEYKRFYYQQKPLLNSHVVAKKVRRKFWVQVFARSRGRWTREDPVLSTTGWDGYKVGGQTPYEIQKGSGRT